MEFNHLRRVFWTVTALFEPDGVGETDEETTAKHMQSDGDTLPGNQGESPAPA